MSRRRSRTLATAPVLAAALAVAAAHGAQTDAVRVHVDPAQRAPLAAVRERIASLTWIEPVGAAAPARLRVTAEGAGFVLRAGSGEAPALAVPAGTPDAARRLADAVVAAAHRAWMHGLDPLGSDLQVAFRVARAGGDMAVDGPAVVEPGAKLRWEARNLSDRPIHVSVFDVSPDGGVTLLHPRRGPGERLDPGDTTDQTVTMLLPDDWEQAPDVFTLVATAGPLDPAGFLAPEALAGTRERLRAGDWQVLRQRVVVRRELAVTPAAPDAGAVAQEPRSGPRRISFEVHYGAPVDVGRVRHRVARLRTLCGRNGSACAVRRLPAGGPHAFELERTGRRLGEAAQLTVASAFEQAYAIREGLGALRAAPRLELVLPGGGGSPRAPLTWADADGALPGSLPLFRALYSAGTPASRAWADYGRLFGLGAGDALESVAWLEAELMHHHALDRVVRRKLGALTAPEPEAEAFAEARAALLRRGLSAPLRDALAAAR